MKKKSKIYASVAGIVTTLAIIFVAISIPTAEVGEVTYYQALRDTWTPVGTGENVTDPTSGDNSGICGFWVFDTGSTYTGNLTPSTEGYISGGGEVNQLNLSNISHSTAFDIVIHARFNVSDSNKELRYAKCNVSSTLLSIDIGDAPDEIHQISNDTDMLFVNFVWDNSDSGYELTRGQYGEIEIIRIYGYT